ncbi:MAG: hypothetical protein HBSIN02_21710 [Bacteroidia bacterium]|nr:MAG: hypothetical protein HBSIN02_21710 [Bacteroidia bacterium]
MSSLRVMKLLMLLCVALAGVLSCSRDTNETRGKDEDAAHSASSNAVHSEQRREELMRAGRYDCCTKPGCTECIANYDSCGCYLAIQQKDPICGECLKGYKAGQGKLKLVSIVELERIREQARLGRATP